MKLTKRAFAQPIGTATLWVIPFMTYGMLRLSGALLPEKEWIWLVFLPLVCATWFTVNFKISKKK